MAGPWPAVAAAGGPALVQAASVRLQSNGSVSLGSTATAGNYILIIEYGSNAGGSNPVAPAGVSQFLYGSNDNSNNGTQAWWKLAAGGEKSFAFTGILDYANFYICEISSQSWPLGLYFNSRHGPASASGSNLVTSALSVTNANVMRFLIVEYDNNATYNPSNDTALLYHENDLTILATGNHFGVVFATDPTVSGTQSIPLSGTPTTPVWAEIQVSLGVPVVLFTSQLVREVLHTANAQVYTSQLVREVLHSIPAAPVYASQVALEVLHSIPAAPVYASQVALEVLHGYWLAQPPLPPANERILGILAQQAKLDDIESGIRSLALRNRSVPNISSALVLGDRVQENTTSTGTGNIICSGPVPLCQSFTVIGAGNTTWYTLLSGDTVNWEVGVGTITQLNPTAIARTSIFSSSNAGNRISLAGTSTIFCDMPASMIQTPVASPSIPTQVQYASFGSATTGVSNVTVTLSSVPSVGNTLLFIIGSYGATSSNIITAAFTGSIQLLKDQATTVLYEQVCVFALTVGPSPATSYTFNIASSVGTTCIFASELSGVRNIASSDQIPTVTGASLYGYVLAPDNALTYVAIVNDNGGITTGQSSGLTLIQQVTGAGGGHSLAIFKYSGSPALLRQNVVFNTTPDAYNLWNVTAAIS